jgi:hypothetical protein
VWRASSLQVQLNRLPSALSSSNAILLPIQLYPRLQQTHFGLRTGQPTCPNYRARQTFSSGVQLKLTAIIYNSLRPPARIPRLEYPQSCCPPDQDRARIESTQRKGAAGHGSPTALPSRKPGGSRNINFSLCLRWTTTMLFEGPIVLKRWWSGENVEQIWTQTVMQAGSYVMHIKATAQSAPGALSEADGAQDSPNS